MAVHMFKELPILGSVTLTLLVSLFQTGTAEMRSQRLVDAGYVVIRCDNRGSSRRGLAFEGAIKHDMGNLEIRDQEAAVRYFVDKGLVNPSQVGIYGWSYGVSALSEYPPLNLSLCQGYMTAMALCKSTAFCCGVSGAPVTSWGKHLLFLSGSLSLCLSLWLSLSLSDSVSVSQMAMTLTTRRGIWVDQSTTRRAMPRVMS
jgi:hypothetical protein